ncbi:uncharacterized protein BX663DRAFT_266310 [Cokeromyces recurvatus]|uniref:uncharacterized protein n=1 Tax=Cokeromyces recurvatus TaxID=90255 RepID=UPI00221FB2FB|nr:uncharacterized protein BX663DRAFT_266310 [Cokeromyces recurvatus]KAI7898231.1 hypothetical protein BX663DRAFT_266310 [Cokeromyces recurvatus]
MMMNQQDNRARSPSINKGSGGSIMSTQTSNFYSSTSTQEFKVVKEGWLYKKNGLMQWKPVYAVAKHGNAIKPGGLYLYKDIKCTNHIHTYDMSEVLEISPRAQDYKQGIKWEFRMLIKRDDIILATDDMLSRKDWIESLTSIMGKVSIATQNELTSRIQSSEQMNRNLQTVAEELDAENAQLKEQIMGLKEAAAKRDKFFQQELQNRENELKEVFAKKERQLHQRLEEREDELITEMDRQRQALETKCEIFEREAMQWRNKYTEIMEKRTKSMDSSQEIESLEIEVRKWRNRVDELEYQLRQAKSSQETTRLRNTSNSSLDNNKDNNGIKETITDVKFNLQFLRDQLKSSSITDDSLSDIKSSIGKLCDTLDEAKSGWSELQSDIIKFLQTEKEDIDMKDAKQKHMFDLLHHEFLDLREELVGVNLLNNKEEKEVKGEGEEEGESLMKAKKLPSLSEKFDILIEMIEHLQVNQSRISTAIMDNHSSTASTTSTDSMPATPTLTYADKDSDLYKAVTSQQQQLSEWIKESREIHHSTLTTIENSLKQTRQLPSAPTDINRLHDKISQTIEAAIHELTKTQQEGQDEQMKNIKVIATASDLNDNDKLTQLCIFVKNTETFMERSLRILSRYGGDNNANSMEETIRRAVKGASKAHLEEVLAIQEQNKDERELIEKKMQRYEENARNYFEKSMEKVHTDLHEFTGVMYEMLERLVLKALEHSPGVTDSDDNSIQSVMELYGKLSGMNQALKAEIKRLQGEKEELEADVKAMKKTSKELEREINERHVELRSITAEYERMNRSIQRSRLEDASDLAKELEPLMQQIVKLRKLASLNDDFSDNGNYVNLGREIKPKPTRSKSPLPSSSMNRRSRYDETDIERNEDNYDEEQENSVRKLRFPSMLNNRNRRNSFTSQYSDNSEQASYTSNSSSNSNNRHHDQQSIKSPLIGSRPRAKSPLSSYLGRK